MGNALRGGGEPSPVSPGVLGPNRSERRRLTLGQISSRSGGPLRPRLPHCGSLRDIAGALHQPAWDLGLEVAGRIGKSREADQAVAVRHGISLARRGNRSASAACNSGTPAPVSALKRTARILAYSSRSTPGASAV